MCRGKNDPRGPSRCIPNSVAAAIRAARGSHKEEDFSRGKGDFWSTNEIFTKKSIHNHIESLKGKLNGGHASVNDVLDVGYMISSHSDNSILDFSARLSDVQSKAAEYKEYAASSIENPEPLRKLYQEVSELSISLNYANRSSLMSILREVRSFGGTHNVDRTTLISSAVIQAGDVYPEQWKNRITTPLTAKNPIDFTDEEKAAYADYSGEGGFFDKSENLLVIYPQNIKGAAAGLARNNHEFTSYQDGLYDVQDQDSYVVAVHEIGHKYEIMSPRMLSLSLDFLKSREIQDKSGQVLHIESLNKDSIRTLDHFADEHSGMSYRWEPGQPMYSTEVLTMGMEGTLLGNNGSFIGLPSPSAIKNNPVIDFHRADPEHRNFTLGLLAAFDLEG